MSCRRLTCFVTLVCLRSRTGLELVCCSIDGSVAYLGFDETEIGIPMPKDEQVRT